MKTQQFNSHIKKYVGALESKRLGEITERIETERLGAYKTASKTMDLIAANSLRRAETVQTYLINSRPLFS